MGVTMGREGTWTVELVRPLRSAGGGQLRAITMQPVSADHMIRWEDERIPSFYALLAELSGVPERVLLGLSGVDLERVMFAFQTLMTLRIRADFEEKSRPMSVAYDDAPHPQDALFQTPAQAPAPPAKARPAAPPRDPTVEPFGPDRVDPRYPDIGGPVVQRPPPQAPRRRPPGPPPADQGSGMNLAPPDVMEKVG